MVSGVSDNILFVGTYPLIHNPSEHENEEKYMKNGIMVWNCDYFAKDRPASDGASRIKLVDEFINKHEHEINYNFLINTESTQMGNSEINPKYKDKIIDIDLTEHNLPSSCFGKYDIVYIDTNTLGFINYRREPNEWVDFFKPLMKENGCMIIDDTDCFVREKYRRGGYRNYLGMEVYNGLTLKLMNTSTHRFVSKNKILQDFVDIVIRYPTFPIFLIPVPERLHNATMKDGLKRYKESWDMI